MTTHRIALATCSTLPEADPDERLLIEPLRALGVEAIPAVWDDPAVDWDAFDFTVIRSTWDYTARREAFIEWARSVTRIFNPPDVIAWNTDKHYLADLAAAGLPVVPTTWLEPGGTIDLPAEGVHVLKPSVGAGSVDAGRFDFREQREAGLARAHANRLLAAGQTVMIQPYLDAIDAHGEAGLIYVGGEFSHAVSKGAMLAGDHALVGGMYKEETITPRTPSAAELSLAQRALAATPGGAERLLYARVDLVPGPDGEPLIIELELTEPSLFMGVVPGSAGRFARAIAKRLAAMD
ncbi:MAG: hypothetical protein ABI797_00365 [Chloroflexota bacterium]